MKYILTFLCLLNSISIWGQSNETLYKFSPPAFGNGDQAFVNYMRERINLKAKDFKYQVKGTINIKFTLTKDGEMKDFVIMDSSTSAHFNKEIFDYLRMSKSLWYEADINHQKCDINILVAADLSLMDGNEIMYILNAGYYYIKDMTLFNAYYNIGSELASKQMYMEAIPYFDVILKYVSTDTDALYNRGVCHLKSSDISKACSDWSVIKNTGKTDADKLIQKYCTN